MRNPSLTLKTIQALIVEFESMHEGIEIPQINIRHFVKRLRASFRHGNKIVAPYYLKKFKEIEDELNVVSLESDLAQEMALAEKELINRGLATCSICKQVLSIDNDICGWDKKKQWHHIGTCPSGEERKINV